jgi:hypothetical protein
MASNAWIRLCRTAASAIVLVGALLNVSVVAEDVQNRAERIGGLVESLNTGSIKRESIVSDIYNELRGENAIQMKQALKAGLYQGGLLVKLGVVESLAMLGDPRDLDDLEKTLEVSGNFVVRTTIIRLLPAFLLHNTERARIAFVRYIYEGRDTPDPAVLTPLRRPPLTRRGRYDKRQDELALRISAIILKQFDPIGAALGHINDPLYGEQARNTALSYTGSALGNNPREWNDIWQSIAIHITPKHPEEIEEIRLAALSAMSDMAMEGTTDAIDAMNFILSIRNPVIELGVLESLVTICRSSYDRAAMVMSPEYGMEDGNEEMAWERRFLDSTLRIGEFAVNTAAARLGSREESIVLAAINAIGAAGSIPQSLPGSEVILNDLLPALIRSLAQVSMAPDINSTKRKAALRSLGEIGTSSSVAVIREILNSPYASPENGPDGQAIAEASVGALFDIVSSGREGEGDARRLLLALLQDDRKFMSPKPNVEPTLMGHIVMWRMQRLAKSGELSFDPAYWAPRLGWN